MDIQGWLRSLGLERYEGAFRENEIDERVLPNLTAEDLMQIGVGPVGLQCSPSMNRVHMGKGAASTISIPKVSALIACVITVAWSLGARADGSSLPYGRGGMTFPEMDGIVQQYNKTGELFRIEGECRSSCAELLAIKNVCIDPDATLEFHATIRTPGQTVDSAKNKRMASYYNSRLRSFVLTNHYMDSWTFHPMSGQEVIQKFGYRQCGRK